VRGAGDDPTCDPPEPVQVSAGTCAFATEPVTYSGVEQVINTLSERLAAPPGGLWWLAEATDAAMLTAASDTRGTVELEVVDDPYRFQSPATALRVPSDLEPGERLRIGCRELSVIPKLGAFDLGAIVLEHARRPDLGGIGFVVRLPPELRSRVFVSEAQFAHAGANVATGVHVLQNLLLADAPALCNSGDERDPDALFVPIHADLTAAADIAVAVSLHDADDREQQRFNRVCAEPYPAAACYRSTLDIPPP
jgi:hypothetical protein